jgi:hypothetical protein
MSNMHGLFVNSWRLFSIFISAIMIISIISPTTAMAAEVLVAPVPIYPANLQEKNLISDSPLGIP